MKKSAKKPHAVQAGTAEANRLAIAILEVLAGLRSPAEAAKALAVSVPRYYQLETRALDGLVLACEPKRQGKQPSLQSKIAALEREVDRAQRECARQQALVRVAHRSVGLKANANASAKSSKADQGRRKRRPTVRALKAVDALRKGAPRDDGETVQPQPTDVAPTGRKSAQGG